MAKFPVAACLLPSLGIYEKNFPIDFVKIHLLVRKYRDKLDHPSARQWKMQDDALKVVTLYQTEMFYCVDCVHTKQVQSCFFSSGCRHSFHILSHNGGTDKCENKS